ncbi:Uncharacterised protein [Legionella beliardensis]|uniref:Uncharacterized protein n=1 Tax=Legionella beliardensis TaxID=91822 RepID=A0A378I319_9GAMM|nr:Uncharacterised protein [Legionella beliardensis]
MSFKKSIYFTKNSIDIRQVNTILCNDSYYYAFTPVTTFA